MKLELYNFLFFEIELKYEFLKFFSEIKLDVHLWLLFFHSILCYKPKICIFLKQIRLYCPFQIRWKSSILSSNTYHMLLCLYWRHECVCLLVLCGIHFVFHKSHFESLEFYIFLAKKSRSIMWMQFLNTYIQAYHPQKRNLQKHINNIK